MPRPVVAQQSKPAATAADYTTQLAAIEKAIDDKRKELGIPGLSLAIVKDDKVIYLKGLGVKDVEKNSVVVSDTTGIELPDTVFRKPASVENKVNAN